MKIRKLSMEQYPKAYALLKQAFPKSKYEMELIGKLHKNGKTLHEWVCIHTNIIIAYIAFSKAFNGPDVCGLHLAPVAVNPDFQRQGIGSELLRFALRQPEIKANTIFVLGDPNFYGKFGFEPCTNPACPFDKGNAHFLGIRNSSNLKYTIGYEPEFY
ncbi:GNAT family N-acetyltransferase [Desulforegula conservatrix]|uniref:GNAT family N-acetyltransferase n=1 Tax=Desulforegula conservatrix TaxID=153026 RepID=UPI00041FAF18|nr:N-acetyltransferase [Desulforegula conservatrix]